jgi:ubiquinone/menaquinone biosynthesis C-methylase UbiE
MKSSTERFQLSEAAAEVYESRFVPALFAEWAPPLLDLAGVAPGQRVLDVACGTGIVARTAADRMRGTGTVVGVDLNEAMLAVARRVRPDLAWRHGDAARLPFADASFDVALCQMALMFFPDRAAALAEMARVLAPGGTAAVVVPGRLDAQPGYAPFVDMAVRHAGAAAAPLLSAYFACGDLAELRALVESAGLRVTGSRTRMGTARFASPDEFVAVEVGGSPLMERIDGGVYDRIRAGAVEALRPFTTPSGAVEVPLQGHVVAARVPA